MINTAWKKVSALSAGQQIAVTSAPYDQVSWDEIESITPLGREEVWDVEVEGTHNFVGNDFVAHNTYISGALGIGTTANGYSGTAPTNGLMVEGNVGIGTTAPGYKLDVAGDINTTGDIRKAGAAYTNPDYVFEPNYSLMPLGELKLFTETNFHLPGVPSSEDIRLNGIALFEQTRLNLEKTEEAYLYLFQQQGQLENLQFEVGVQASSSATLAGLGPRVAALEDDTLKLKDQVALLQLQASTSAGLLDSGSGVGMMTSPAGDLKVDGNVAIYKNLNVLGKTTVSDLGVTGKITAGLLVIDGLSPTGDATVDALAGTLKFQSLGLGAVDFFNGRLVIDKTGNLTTVGMIKAAAVAADEYRVNSSSSDSATLPASATEIVVTSPAALPDSKIFVTATSSTGDQSLIVKAKGTGSFTVAVEHPVAADITFDYWIIGSE